MKTIIFSINLYLFILVLYSRTYVHSYISAKEEVARLRKLLSENYESVSHLLFANILNSPRKDGDIGENNEPHVVEEDMFDSAVADLDDSINYDTNLLKSAVRSEPRKPFVKAAPRVMDRATHRELEALEAELDVTLSLRLP
jgi:hypothetical protein